MGFFFVGEEKGGLYVVLLVFTKSSFRVVCIEHDII